MTVDVEGVEFATAVSQARKPKALRVGEKTYGVVDVSGIPGADRLPRALVELLEN